MRKVFDKLNKSTFAISLLPTPACGDWSCANIADVSFLINHIINLLLPLAGGIAMIFLIWGGIQYLTSFGNEERVQKGKIIIIWSVVGIVVILLSKIIVGEIIYLLTGTRTL